MERQEEDLNMYGIELINVEALVGDFKLKNINLALPKGSIIGLLGENGAGKTTLFNTLLGTHLKTSGDMYLNGLTYQSNEREIRESLAIVHDTMNINPFTKGKKLYKYNKMMYQNFDDEYFKSLCEEFQIPLNKRMSNMSLGAQKKLSLAIVLAIKPKILLLDEPFIGIDPIDKQRMIKHIQNLMEDEERTIFLSSHYVEDIEKISDYIAIISHGEIKLFNEKDEILDQYVMVLQGDDPAYKNHVLFSKESRFGLQGLMKKETALKYDIIYQRPTLEEIFIFMSKKEVVK